MRDVLTRANLAALIPISLVVFGCSRPSVSHSVSITPMRDTASLVRVPGRIYYNIDVTLKNLGTGYAYYVGCEPAGERKIEGAWTLVFPVLCPGYPTDSLAPGSSEVLHVREERAAFGNGPPPVSLIGGGLHRLVFQIGYRARNGEIFWPTPAATFSQPFVVLDSTKILH